jgi:Ni/Co efflux regulator RcnB
VVVRVSTETSTSAGWVCCGCARTHSHARHTQCSADATLRIVRNEFVHIKSDAMRFVLLIVLVLGSSAPRVSEDQEPSSTGQCTPNNEQCQRLERLREWKRRRGVSLTTELVTHSKKVSVKHLHCRSDHWKCTRRLPSRRRLR